MVGGRQVRLEGRCVIRIVPGLGAGSFFITGVLVDHIGIVGMMLVFIEIGLLRLLFLVLGLL